MVTRGPADEPEHELEHLRRLREILARASSLRSLEDEELTELPRLYRHASSVLARLETSGRDPRLAAGARSLVGRAHALLYAQRDAQQVGLAQRVSNLFLCEAPRAIRSEWRLLSLSFALLYGLAALAWYAVGNDLDLAPSLLDPAVVTEEIRQLRDVQEGEPFRGNFNFGLRESPATAGWIMLNNIRVGVLFFAFALIPPLYLYVLGTNALMLGTYTAVAGHWGQAGAISSILWCHGVLEIQAIVLSGTAGLCLIRAWVRPGAWTRRHALQVESRRALVLLAPMVPMLVLAGLIEGFITPHAPAAVRLTIAVLSGMGLLLWALLGGRSDHARSLARGQLAKELG